MFWKIAVDVKRHCILSSESRSRSSESHVGCKINEEERNQPKTAFRLKQVPTDGISSVQFDPWTHNNVLKSPSVIDYKARQCVGSAKLSTRVTTRALHLMKSLSCLIDLPQVLCSCVQNRGYLIWGKHHSVHLLPFGVFFAFHCTLYIVQELHR